MNSKSFTKMFLFLGILFGLTAVCLSILPRITRIFNDEYIPSVKYDEVVHQYKKTDTTIRFDNAGYGAIALGIISATCFIVAGNLIKSSKEV